MARTEILIDRFMVLSLPDTTRRLEADTHLAPCAPPRLTFRPDGTSRIVYLASQRHEYPGKNDDVVAAGKG
jgi:hypothetical protein